MEEKTYDVTFKVNGGNAVTKQTIKHNEKATKSTDPTKDGYTFGGWYSDEALTSVYDFDTAVTSDLTLYAKWEEVVVEPEPETPVVEEPTEPETPVEDNQQEETLVVEDDTDTKDKVNVAVIAGGVAGGVVAVGVIGTIIDFAIKKRKLK